VIMRPTLGPVVTRCRERIGQAAPGGTGVGETAPVTRTAGPADDTARRRVPPDVLACGALYVLALAVDLASVSAVGQSLVLMGEEMSVSVRDVLFSVEQHAQATVWSTNFGAPVYYWAASHLDPSYSLFSARRWKAAAMAALAPLAYLVLRRRLRCGRGSALFGGALVVLLPGVAMFGWLATEDGLESVLGTAGLYLATSRRRVALAAPVLAGLAVTTYTAGVAWAAVIVGAVLWRGARSGWRTGLAAVAALLVGAGVVLFPLWWWTAGPHRLVAGGGTIAGTPSHNLANLGRQLAVSGRSYYFFSTLPALGSTAFAAVSAVAVGVAVVTRWRAVRPWVAVAAVTVAVWIPSGNAPGVRRAVALSIVAALTVAVAVDVLGDFLPRGRGPALAGVAAAVCLPLAVSLLQWQDAYRTGASRLTPDFPLAVPMPAALAAYDADLRSGRLTVDDAVRDDDGTRVLAAVWLLADRSGRGTAGLPTPKQIVRASLPR
jgi:hypothetical protein